MILSVKDDGKLIFPNIIPGSAGPMFRPGNKVESVESIAMSRLLDRDGRSFRTITLINPNQRKES
jgi:hypothetical protein